MSIHARSRNAFAGIEELKALPVGREARDRTYGFLILLFRFREQCLNGSFSSSLLFISIDRGFTRSGHFWEIGLAALLVIIRTLCSFTEERDRRVFSFFFVSYKRVCSFLTRTTLENFCSWNDGSFSSNVLFSPSLYFYNTNRPRQF